jgi:hypothetical protein
VAGNISRLTIITAVFGRSEELISNLQAYNLAIGTVDDRPVRMFIFSRHPQLTKFEFTYLLRKYLDKKTPVVVYDVSPDGIYNALNYGISSVKSEFFIFNHSDDYFTPNAFKHISNSEIDSSDVSSFGIIVNDKIASPLVDAPFPYSCIGINHSATIFKSNVHKKFKYNTKMKYSSDWDLIIRMYNEGVTFQAFPYVISIFSDGGASNLLAVRRLHEDVSILLKSSLRSKYFGICSARIVKEILGFISRLLGLI